MNLYFSFILLCCFFNLSVFAQDNIIEDEESSWKPDETPNEFFPRQVYFLQIHQNYWYSPKKKKITKEIEAISLVISGCLFPNGIDHHLSTYDYQILKETIFKGKNNAIKWVNPLNPLQHADFAAALEQGWYKAALLAFQHPVTEDIIHGDYYPSILSECYNEEIEQDKIDEFLGEIRKVYKDQNLLQDISVFHQFSKEDTKGKIPCLSKRKKGDIKMIRLLYQLNLNDTLNQSFMPFDREISKLLIEATKSKIVQPLKPYWEDSEKKHMSLKEFKENLALPKVDEDFFGDGEDW